MARSRRSSLMEREELRRMLAAAASTLSRELARQHVSPVTYRSVLAHQRAQRAKRRIVLRPVR